MNPTRVTKTPMVKETAPADDRLEHGLIIKAQSGFFTVRTDSGDEIVCQLRGRLKRTKTDSDLAAIGDYVKFRRLPEDSGRSAQSGVIEEIDERTSVLMRRSPTPRKRRYAARGQGYLERDRGAVIIANPDQAVFVFACADPNPHLRMLDRFLVVAEANHVMAIICANKADLVSETTAKALFGIYADIGYQVIYTSAETGQGVAALREQLTGNISVLAGPSGVGKSSLLNRIQPELGLAVRNISQATTKGRHTTVHRQLHPLNSGGWVADTPGLRALALYDMTPEEIDGYFIEIAPLVANCEFSNCAHSDEPGCAVRQALQTGQLHPSRYDSYLRLRQGIYD